MTSRSTHPAVTLAQQRGSTATTAKGAIRWLRAHPRPLHEIQPLRLPGDPLVVQLRAEHAAAPWGDRRWTLEREIGLRSPISRAARKRHDDTTRRDRLCARYRAARRLPRYLSAADRALIDADPSRREILHLRALPRYARALYPRPIGLPDREYAAWTRAAGELRANAMIAQDAFARARWGRLRKIYPGRASMTPGIRTETNGRGGWDKVSWHYADYTYIVPRARHYAWTGYYVDPRGDMHKVLRTRDHIRIDGGPVQAVERKCAAAPAWPVHVQRRMLAYAAGRLTVEYDREAKALMLVDPREGHYHVPPVRTARDAQAQVEVARQAFTRRRIERRNQALDAWLGEQADRVWVSVRDSIDAGNCAVGTENYARRLAAHLSADGELGAVRADVILAHRDDSYTRRACRVAALRAMREEVAA